MDTVKFAALLATTLAVSACGGTAPSTVSPFSTGGGTEVITGALEIQTSEFAGVDRSARTAYELFTAANQLAPTPVTASTASYNGTFISRIGTNETFIDGDIDVDLNFASGTGSGTLSSLEITGADTLNRNLLVSDTFSVAVPTLSNTGFTGTVSGSVSDDPAQVSSAGVDTYTIAGTLDGTFVSDSSQDAVVGVVGGTITSTGLGTQPLDGVFSGQQ